MYNVTIIGSRSVGKSSLWMQWSSILQLVLHNRLKKITFHHLPYMICVLSQRFVKNFEQYYDKTDIFVLVVNKDCSHLPLFEELSHTYREAIHIEKLAGFLF